jgi:hypothetical protein
MLRGHYDYKVRLGSEKRYNYRVMVFRDSLMGRGIEAALHIRTMLKGKRPWQTELEWPVDGEVGSDESERAPRAPEGLASSTVRVE